MQIFGMNCPDRLNTTAKEAMTVHVRIDGIEDTKSRFLRYVKSNPAAERGWVAPENESVYQVTDDYLDPFKEIAANFGLTAEVNPTDER